MEESKKNNFEFYLYLVILGIVIFMLVGGYFRSSHRYISPEEQTQNEMRGDNADYR